MGGDLHQSIQEGVIRVRVIPRAKADEISEILQDGRVKIRLVAPPVDGKANKSLKILLSSVLEVPRSSIEIHSGSTGRDKVVRVNGLDQPGIDTRIKKSCKKKF